MTSGNTQRGYVSVSLTYTTSLYHLLESERVWENRRNLASASILQNVISFDIYARYSYLLTVWFSRPWDLPVLFKTSFAHSRSCDWSKQSTFFRNKRSFYLWSITHKFCADMIQIIFILCNKMFFSRCCGANAKAGIKKVEVQPKFNWKGKRKMANIKKTTKATHVMRGNMIDFSAGSWSKKCKCSQDISK